MYIQFDPGTEQSFRFLKRLWHKNSEKYVRFRRQVETYISSQQHIDSTVSSGLTAVSVNRSLMQLNCFASAQEPGISNSSSILRASFIRWFVMRERTWQREQRVSYVSRRSACGGNRVSSAGQEWRLRSPGEVRRQWTAAVCEGGWLTHISAGRGNLGMAAGRWRRGGGGLHWPRCPVRGLLIEMT